MVSLYVVRNKLLKMSHVFETPCMYPGEPRNADQVDLSP